ncbi:hypothetical protein FRC17_001382 [Serendipita sp. 399]|nr:hypothetical protein FRC17_001382 [Serendipita sp. 399]
MGPVGTWWEALLAYIISETLWAEFGLGVYYRRGFLKRTQPQAAPINPQNKILKNPHEKVLFSLMFVCIAVSYIELGLLFGHGWFSGYSLWMVPVAVGLTELLHAIALPMWKNTTKNRRGAINPSSVYSLTLAILFCLLALLWLAAAIVSFLLVEKYGTNFYTPRPGNRHGGLLNCVRWVVAGLALFVSLLLWTEFGLVFYYRTLFLRRIQRVQIVNANNLCDGYSNVNANANANTNTNTFNANNQNKGAIVDNQHTNANRYSTGNPYEQPSPPPLTYNPNYQPAYPSPYGYNPNTSPSFTPTQLPSPPFYNPVYQPSFPSPPIATNPLNPMFQKDAGA